MNVVRKLKSHFYEKKSLDSTTPLISVSCFLSERETYRTSKNNDTIQRSLGGSKAFLKANDSVIQETVISNSGDFMINGIKPGVYSITINTIGFRNETKDSIQVSENFATTLNLDFPFPCKYLYTNGKKPNCIFGHSDNIIPIIYGLPTPKTRKAALKGLVFLGGCIVGDCDPKFYCKTHKREL